MRAKNIKIGMISNKRYFCHPVSNTFHGRDIFAGGGSCGGGVPPFAIRKSIADYLRLDLAQATRTGRRTWTG